MNSSNKNSTGSSPFLSQNWMALLLVWPLGALYESLRKFRNPLAKNAFWMFCVFMGFTFIYDPIGGSNADSIRYAENLVYLHDHPIDWDNFRQSFFDSSGGYLDVFQPTLMFIVSIFTDNVTIFFALVALVFGFFYSRNMWFVLDKIPIKINRTLFILLATLFLLVPIWNISGVRMWTACHMFVYGALPLLWNNDKSKAIWSLLSFFVHFSFFIPIVILMIYYFLPLKKLYPILIFYIVSLFLSEIDMDIFRSLGQSLPSMFQGKVAGYTSEAYVDTISDIRASTGLLPSIIRLINIWGVAIILLSIGFIDTRVLKSNVSLKNLFLFSLFFLSIANIISQVPSGGRFVAVARIFVFAFIILYYVYVKMNHLKTTSFQYIQLITWLFIITLFLPIRTPSVFYGLEVLTNPIIAIFIDSNETFYSLVKNL